MALERQRIYADTSVYGGCFDEEFDSWSQLFFDQVRAGRFALVASAVVERELQGAPQPVSEFYRSLSEFVELAALSDEALELRSAYLAAGIVGAASTDDALHVALASTTRCDLIVSWNFKHIVHAGKVPLYNAVNTLRGWPAIRIHSPPEVLHYEGR